MATGCCVPPRPNVSAAPASFSSGRVMTREKPIAAAEPTSSDHDARKATMSSTMSLTSLRIAVTDSPRCSTPICPRNSGTPMSSTGPRSVDNSSDWRTSAGGRPDARA